MDECANLGRLPDFAAILTLMRAYNVRICPYFQSRGQVDELYEKAAPTIISSCAAFVYLGVEDADTFKSVSDRLGETTISERNLSRDRGNRGSSSESDHLLGRPLLKPDEVGKLRRSQSIVFISGMYPFKGRKIRTGRLPGADEIGIDDEKHPHFLNNEYVEETYKAVYEARLADYQTRQAAESAAQRLNLLDLTDDEEEGASHKQIRTPEEFEQAVGYSLEPAEPALEPDGGPEYPEDLYGPAGPEDPYELTEEEFLRDMLKKAMPNMRKG
jgi:hypothetical protein